MGSYVYHVICITSDNYAFTTAVNYRELVWAPLPQRPDKTFEAQLHQFMQKNYKGYSIAVQQPMHSLSDRAVDLLATAYQIIQWNRHHLVDILQLFKIYINRNTYISSAFIFSAVWTQSLKPGSHMSPMVGSYCILFTLTKNFTRPQPPTMTSPTYKDQAVTSFLLCHYIKFIFYRQMSL